MILSFGTHQTYCSRFPWEEQVQDLTDVRWNGFPIQSFSWLYAVLLSVHYRLKRRLKIFFTTLSFLGGLTMGVTLVEAEEDVC